MPGLVILPFDSASFNFQRINLASVGPYSMNAIQTSQSVGILNFTLIAGGAFTYNAFGFIQAQQVESIIDEFVLSGGNFLDISSKLPLQQLYTSLGGGTGQLTLPSAGGLVVVFGAGFTQSTTAVLQNAAGTVTIPIPITVSRPGALTFVAPDNSIAPWNQLDTANTNNLILTNPGGITSSSANAPTAFSFGWT